MFPLLRPSSPRRRSASCSTDDHPCTRDRPRRLFQRHDAHDHAMSCHSHHDDLPLPSLPVHTPRTTSTHSTPMTSPSTAYSTLFPASLSSATSESADSKHRSEFGMLIPGSPRAVHGSASSRSSINPVSPLSRSPTESDNARSHSRLTVGIKNIFSRHTPSRLSFSTPESEASSSSFHVPVAGSKWSLTHRKSRPPDPEISDVVAPPIPSHTHGSNTHMDAHRRYASEVPAKIHDTKSGSGRQSVDVSSRNQPPSRVRDPKTRNVLRRRPSAKLCKARERGTLCTPSRSNESDPDHLCTSHQGPVPFPLTPAGAVVEAYKQQELYRDEDIPCPPKLSIDNRMGSATSHDSGCDRDHPALSPTPYYTVFGASSDRRLPAGGPDDRWGRFGAGQCILTPSQATHQPSMSDPGSRSLSHKISIRWRRAKGKGVAPDDSPERSKGHSKGRRSLQDVWGNDRSSIRSVDRSMDGMNPADGAWASPTVSAGHARSGSKSDGPKLWRLMRRISTGGLRDQLQPDKAVPPVPAIPKELLNKGEPHNKGRTPTTPRNIISVATSSSSPNSSSVASMQFFQKSHSPRSSVSSYGEAIVLPRAPEAMLERHIITPLEQLRLADVESGGPSSRSPRRSTSVPAGRKTAEDAEGDHVPLPSLPRRQTCPRESPPPGPSRPCSTSPSYQSLAAAPGKSRIVDGIVSLSPPPRPRRSSTRGGSGSVASSPSHSMVVKHTDVVGIGIGIGNVRQIDRTPSGRSDMTARLDSPEPGRDRDASPRMRTQLTFRELDAPRRPPLSEREKMDVWNDLLARSDEAGGTLHINGAAELMSDSMRLSTYSGA